MYASLRMVWVRDVRHQGPKLVGGPSNKVAGLSLRTHRAYENLGLTSGLHGALEPQDLAVLGPKLRSLFEGFPRHPTSKRAGAVRQLA